MVDYEEYLESLCPGCSQPFDLAMDPTATFSVTDQVCWSCNIRESRVHQMQRHAGEHPQMNFGVKVWISGARPNPPI